VFDSGEFELGKADMLSDTSSSWSEFILIQQCKCWHGGGSDSDSSGRGHS